MLIAAAPPHVARVLKASVAVHRIGFTLAQRPNHICPNEANPGAGLEL